MEGSMSEEKKVVNESVEAVTTKNESQVQPESEGLIAESKKYRKRAQDAEARIAQLEAKFNEQENAKLKEQEEFKELAEKLESELNKTTPYKEKFEAMEKKSKEKLLQMLPESKRDEFKDKDLDVLEFMVENLAAKSASEPQARGVVQSKKDVSNWLDLNPQEQKSSWKDILSSYKQKK